MHRSGVPIQANGNAIAEQQRKLAVFSQRPTFFEYPGDTDPIFGLLQDTKFTAGLFVPLFALVIIAEFGLRIAEFQNNKLRVEPVRATARW